MKLIDVDSKATLEDFLTLKKVSFKSRSDELPRTTIQIANDNSIFCKEGISG
jgi:hypothetical protein